MNGVCRRVLISGRVQGVGFRHWTVARARVRALDGWVRNRADGSVEALFCGAEAEVQAMIEESARGPRGAVVTGVESAEAPPPAEAGFRQMPTG
jgi:acylphosphatase